MTFPDAILLKKINPKYYANVCSSKINYFNINYIIEYILRIIGRFHSESIDGFKFNTSITIDTYTAERYPELFKHLTRCSLKTLVKENNYSSRWFCIPNLCRGGY